MADWQWHEVRRSLPRGTRLIDGWVVPGPPPPTELLNIRALWRLLTAKPESFDPVEFMRRRAPDGSWQYRRATAEEKAADLERTVEEADRFPG